MKYRFNFREKAQILIRTKKMDFTFIYQKRMSVNEGNVVKLEICI